MGGGDAMTQRSVELTARLEQVRANIAIAATQANRDPSDVQLTVVTKTWPASDVRILADLGVTDVAENRDQEASPKAAELADLDLRWHFIGQLQTNKANSVVRYAQVVESVDRIKLANALDRAAVARDIKVRVLLQVSLDTAGQEHRGGLLSVDALGLAEHVASCDHLELGGVMGVAPLGEDSAEAFERLRAVSERISDVFSSATDISAGMSGDYAAAIKAGATHVRMGAAVLGHRPSVR